MFDSENIDLSNNVNDDSINSFETFMNGLNKNVEEIFQQIYQIMVLIPLLLKILKIFFHILCEKIAEKF